MNNTNIKKQTVTPFFEVHENPENGYRSMYATKDLEPFTVLMKFSYHEVLNTPTRFTVQVNENEHIGLKPTYLQYINHSCRPNVFFDTRTMELITIEPIKTGGEVAFFYPSTEWKMTEPFNCQCKSHRCLGRIRGAAYLTHDELTNYRLSDYVIHQYGRLPELQYRSFTKFDVGHKLETLNGSLTSAV